MLSITSVLHTKPSFFTFFFSSKTLRTRLMCTVLEVKKSTEFVKRQYGMCMPKIRVSLSPSWGDMYKLWTFTRLTGGSCVSISAKLLNRMALTLWCACVWNYFPFWVGFSQSVFFSNLSKCYNHSAINDCIVFFGHVLGIPRCPVFLWKKHTFQIPYRSHFGADTLNDSINIMLLDWWGNNFNLTSFTRVYQGESRKLESILLFTLYFFYYRGCGTS